MKSPITKPMLAAPIKNLPIRFPVIMSPKLDGIRCLKIGGKVLSRSLKPIPNEFIRTELEKALPEGADGEIMVGDRFQDVTSGVMSQKGEPDFTYWMFDLVTKLEQEYVDRIYVMEGWAKVNEDPRIKIVPTAVAYNLQQLDEYEEAVLTLGYEGVMIRDPEGPYKCGRATEKQGWLLKLKRFMDSEAVIVGFEERMHNTNEAKRNELGYLQRAHTKEGRVGLGTLGKLIVREIGAAGWEKEFGIGTGEGLDDATRKEIWERRDELKGQVVKYKYQPHGSKDAPRLPLFVGFRHKKDMS